MFSKTPEEQANGRYILCVSAQLACNDGFSIQDWLDNPEVQRTCAQYELEESILEHIAHWVWRW